MSKHTRGPWIAEPVMGDYPHDICLGYEMPREGNPVVIASVYFHEDAAKGEFLYPLEANANARLIAAAPELLAACEAAIDANLGSHNHWDHTMQHGAGCQLCIRQKEAARKIRAAIAKAKGGTA